MAISIFDFPITDKFTGWTKRSPEQGQCQCPAHEDRTASLSVGLGEQGRKLLLECHAGCSTKAILDAFGETWSALFEQDRERKRGRKPNRKGAAAMDAETESGGAVAVGGNGQGDAGSSGGGSGNRKSRIVATYPYQDVAGNEIFQVVRFHPKSFRQRHREGNRWVWKGVPEDQRALYRLPELVAAPAGSIVFLVEGEKDCDRLRASHLVATTAPGGADAGRSKKPSDKWLPQYTETLRGRVVVIVPDADAPGRQHAANVAAKILGAAAEVSILDLPVIPGIDPSKKWDVSDWLDAGGTRQQFFEAVERARAFPLSADTVAGLQKSAASSTGTAAAMDREHAGDIDPMDGARRILADHYTHSDGSLTLRSWRGTWHYWRDGAYSEISDAAIRASVWMHVDQTHTNVSNRVVANILSALHSLTFVADSVSQPTWLRPSEPRHDADDYLSTADGIVHLPSLLDGAPEVIPHTPEYFAAVKLPFSVFPGGGAGAGHGDNETPTAWLEFLRAVWPAEGDMTEGGCIDTLQEWMGYCLTHSTALQKMLLIVGPPRSGKGTISRIMRRVVGELNCTGPTLSSLSSQHGLWPLAGKSLAIVADARLSNRIDQALIVERVLSITGEDAQLVERKYHDPVVMRLPTRFVMLTNELPKLTDASGALASRMIILPMSESFLGREDFELENKLIQELPAIFRWSIEGLRRLKANGRIAQPAAGKELVDELAELTSPIKSFLNDRCLIGAGHTVSKEALYGAYQIWCNEHGFKASPQNYFGRDLRAAVPSIEVKQVMALGVRQRFYCGLSIKPELHQYSSWSTPAPSRPSQDDPPIGPPTIPFSEFA